MDHDTGNETEGALDSAGPYVVWVGIAAIAVILGWVMWGNEENFITPDLPQVAAAPMDAVEDSDAK